MRAMKHGTAVRHLAEVLMVLDLSRRHLHPVLDRFHEPDWRRSLRGSGRYAEDHLGSAAQGLREIEDALAG
jgi:hypothetical protein